MIGVKHMGRVLLCFLLAGQDFSAFVQPLQTHVNPNVFLSVHWSEQAVPPAELYFNGSFARPTRVRSIEDTPKIADANPLPAAASLPGLIAARLGLSERWVIRSTHMGWIVEVGLGFAAWYFSPDPLMTIFSANAIAVAHVIMYALLSRYGGSSNFRTRLLQYGAPFVLFNGYAFVPFLTDYPGIVLWAFIALKHIRYDDRQLSGLLFAAEDVRAAKKASSGFSHRRTPVMVYAAALLLAAIGLQYFQMKEDTEIEGKSETQLIDGLSPYARKKAVTAAWLAQRLPAVPLKLPAHEVITINHVKRFVKSKLPKSAVYAAAEVKGEPIFLFRYATAAMQGLTFDRIHFFERTGVVLQDDELEGQGPTFDQSLGSHQHTLFVIARFFSEAARTHVSLNVMERRFQDELLQRGLLLKKGETVLARHDKMIVSFAPRPRPRDLKYDTDNAPAKKPPANRPIARRLFLARA